MKKFDFKYVLIILLCTLFQVSATAQIMPPDLYVLQVYPSNPTTSDSVFVSLTYTSNDGCPDYYLVKDSVESFMVSVATRKINNSDRACTLAFTKFNTKINLGLLAQSTRIYVDGVLLQTINPTCTINKKGVVVKGTGNCTGKLFISEHTPYATLLPVLYTTDKIVMRNATGTSLMDLRAGDEVAFGANPNRLDTTRSTCLTMGDAICCEILSRLPDCIMNKTGVIVPGIDGCTGQWFVKDLSPVYSYPRLYLIKNDGTLKAGAKVIFGTTEVVKDSTMSILCPIYGLVKCFFYAEPINLDTLAGTAYTGDSIVKAGTAVLIQKGYRKALRSMALKEGRFVFPNLPAADYTVYVIPDKLQNPGYLPTFYINKMAFKNADYFTLQDGLNEIAVNLCKFEKRPGKGKIYGNVYFETSSLKDSVLNYYGAKNYLYTTDNNLAVNLPVILFNTLGKPIAWTISDNYGNYVFEDIAIDTYKIVTETAETSAESTVALTTENAVVGADMMLKVQDVVDALEAPAVTAFKLYPNPTTDKFYIQTALADVARIYNSLGQMVMEQHLMSGKNQLDVQHLNKGMYIVKVGMHLQKLIRE